MAVAGNAPLVGLKASDPAHFANNCVDCVRRFILPVHLMDVIVRKRGLPLSRCRLFSVIQGGGWTDEQSAAGLDLV